MDSVIARVWKESCIFGRAYFYVYSHDSEIYVTDALPLDTFVIYDNTVAHKPLYAVRYGHIGSAKKLEGYGINLVEDRIKKLMNFIPKKDIIYSSDPYIEGLTEEEIAYFDK